MNTLTPTIRRALVASLFLIIAADAQPADASSDAWRRASQHTQQGEWSQAVAAYEEHLRDHPADAWSWYALGSIRHGQADYEGARDALRQALDHQVSVPGRVQFSLAGTLARLGRDDEAFELLGEAADTGLLPGASFREDPDLESLDPRRLEAVAARADRANAPCRHEPGYDALDFWVGTWEVRVDPGFLAGRNLIERSEDGCLVTQTWTGTLGATGRSFSTFDPTTDRWTQTWVGNRGAVATLTGGPTEGGMVLEGPGASGPDSRTRTSWLPQADGSLSVISEASEDGGETWTPTSKLIHHRVDDAP